MIEAGILMFVGGVLARTVLWPIQMRLQRRARQQQEARDQAAVADLLRRARENVHPLT